MAGFFDALPNGLSSTPALVAYAVTLVVVVVYVLRLGRLTALRGSAAALAGPERRAALVRGLRLGAGTRLDPERVLRGRILASRLAIGFVILASVATVVIVTANARTNLPAAGDRLARAVLRNPGAAYQADRTFLATGPALLAETGTDLRPRPSSEEIQAAVDAEALAGGGVGRQGAVRAALLNLGAFQRANTDLLSATARIDAAYAPLAQCFAGNDCRRGSTTADLCVQLAAIIADVAAVNAAAAAVPNVRVAGVSIAGDDDAEPEVLFEGLRLTYVPALAGRLCN
ncbi:MAG: hypothetical protein KIS96_05620 [Bauldia sp.]|nr:hypothetical protein [Bauldia sp.]